MPEWNRTSLKNVVAWEKQDNGLTIYKLSIRKIITHHHQKLKAQIKTTEHHPSLEVTLSIIHKRVPYFLWNHVHNSHHLSQRNSVHTLISHFPKNHFNIVLVWQVVSYFLVLSPKFCMQSILSCAISHPPCFGYTKRFVLGGHLEHVPVLTECFCRCIRM
jgi:hypothetical protein